MPFLIAYDIEHDKLRLKAANRMLADGFIRLQYSVFAGDPGEVLMRELEVWLEELAPKDAKKSCRILILPCTQRQLEVAKIFGAPPDEWADLLQPPNTLII